MKASFVLADGSQFKDPPELAVASWTAIPAPSWSWAGYLWPADVQATWIMKMPNEAASVRVLLKYGEDLMVTPSCDRSNFISKGATGQGQTREYEVRNCFSPGCTFIAASTREPPRSLEAVFAIVVLEPRSVTTAFLLMSDLEGHAAAGPKNSLDDLIAGANGKLRPRTNVELKRTGQLKELRVDLPMDKPVRYHGQKPSDRDNWFQPLKAGRNPQARFNVIFTPSLADGDGLTFQDDRLCLFNGDAGKDYEAHVLGHETGHLLTPAGRPAAFLAGLGLDEKGHSSDPTFLMYEDSAPRGSVIGLAHALAMNQLAGT